MGNFGRKAWIPTTWPGLFFFYIGVGLCGLGRTMQVVGIPLSWFGVVLAYIGLWAAPIFVLLAVAALLS
ncbi:MAG: hypothetical protein ACD_24C00282G0002 [uncultured bacterium]|uniref:Uncharacterized protein n=2 Tax=Katanobacteria TaxID=422282 RepID=A0A1F4V229_UNCKA|nr:MAG: hypothetical protein ACD_24C00282G0002 [uncultured bacterium]OGC48633.1 MAG: hypothetical protein A3A69_00525 [candidate division WWE3 bacterium RIFCSPLOWO2_01_FULL_37_15]OGC51275.1 MAG: hypothetical protein A2W32_01490 [candidate division WWE3 bacterium RBG_16_37_10]